MSVERIGRLDGKTNVVLWDVNFREKLVGLLEGGDAVKTQFLDEPVLMGFKTSLDAPFGLGGVSGHDFDAQFFHGACELCEGLFVTELLFDGGLAVDFVDRIFVNVERDGTAVPQEVRSGGPQKVECVFHRNKFSIENSAGGIVDKKKQHAARASSLEPVVIGAVKLNQYTDT